MNIVALALEYNMPTGRGMAPFDPVHVQVPDVSTIFGIFSLTVREGGVARWNLAHTCSQGQVCMPSVRSLGPRLCQSIYHLDSYFGITPTKSDMARCPNIG